jgi:starch phosphorylase
LNLSELDGWWAEAYEPEVGWGLGDGKEHGDDPAWDAAEAEQLYDILENQVIQRFYDRDDAGIPRKWVGMIRESMARLTPEFSANRTVREYTEKYYLPAAAAYRQREAAQGLLAQQISQWREAVAGHWSKLKFGNSHAETIGDFHNFHVEVTLGELDPTAVRVELYAQPLNGSPGVQHPMDRSQPVAGSIGGFIFTAQVPSNRPASDYTPRIMPAFIGAQVPLEAKQILWFR